MKHMILHDKTYMYKACKYITLMDSYIKLK
jgi:hypothetical protein